MLEIWEIIYIKLLLTTHPSATSSFPVKELSAPGSVQRIITDDYHWIRRKVRKIQINVQEEISRDKLTANWVRMFSRRER